MATRCCSPPDNVRSKRGPQMRNAEQVECLLDALAHHRRYDAELLHRVREFFFDGVGDEAAQRVLADVSHDVGEVAGFGITGGAAVDRHLARQRPAAEVGHEPVDRTEQRRLAHTGATDDETELALRDLAREVTDDGCCCARVPERHGGEPDHARATGIAPTNTMTHAAIGSTGQSRSCADGFSAAVPSCDITSSPAPTTPPQAATSHSGTDQGAGR